MSTSFKFDATQASGTASVLPSGTLHDITDGVNQGPALRVSEVMTKGHPLESRLENWESSQLNTKLHMQRKIYGLHAPMRTMMELQSVGQGAPFGAVGARASRIQLDILMGKDETLDATDLFDEAEITELPDLHRTLGGRRL
ncbi:hypothetical protein GGI07_004821 [Coemansia sp. Benny D115]|nr:hypothetical protein GGI07_004821 [Coemansia sp. Benny D115]